MTYLKLVEKSGLGSLFISMCAVLSFVVVFGLIANALLISSVLRQPSLRRSPTYVTLVSLAISDFFSLLTGLLCFWYFYTLPVNRHSCAFILFSMSVGICSSTHHLVAFSVLRYLILVKPLFAMKYLTVKASVVVCVIVWIISGILSLPSTFFSRIVPLNTTQNVTFSICVEESSSNAHAISMVTLMVFLPMSMIMGFHLSKVCHLRRTLHHGSRRHISSKIVISILITFWVTNVPGGIYWIVSHKQEVENKALEKHAVQLIFFGVCNINNAIDPLFYFYFSARMWKDICCCRNSFDERQKPINVTLGSNPANIGSDHSSERVLGHQPSQVNMSANTIGHVCSDQHQEDVSPSASSRPYQLPVTQM